MSNLIIKNRIYDGVIIKTDKISTKSLAENTLVVGCGVKLGGEIHRLATLGLGGMEGLAGIPGTVGGMIKQNAGAFGFEISDRFLEATCYDIKDGTLSHRTKEDMRFSYRDSRLSEKKEVLISASFELTSRKSEDIVTDLRKFRRQRISTQPTECPSLGSIFKQNNGVSAGFYIDKSGLKGFSIGGAQISEKHAGFIVNKGGATADDFIRLIDYAKKCVYSNFGVELSEEIDII